MQDSEYLYLVMELVRGRELLRLINACAAAVRASTASVLKDALSSPSYGSSQGHSSHPHPHHHHPFERLVGYKLNSHILPVLGEDPSRPLACGQVITAFYTAQASAALVDAILFLCEKRDCFVIKSA